jgi:hypothetical protein
VDGAKRQVDGRLDAGAARKSGAILRKSLVGDRTERAAISAHVTDFPLLDRIRRWWAARSEHSALAGSALAYSPGSTPTSATPIACGRQRFPGCPAWQWPCPSGGPYPDPSARRISKWASLGCQPSSVYHLAAATTDAMDSEGLQAVKTSSCAEPPGWRNGRRRGLKTRFPCCLGMPIQATE